MPAMMPQPIRAGISGTKMLAIRRRNSLTGVAFFAFRPALRAAPWAASSSAVVGPAGTAGAGGAASGPSAAPVTGVGVGAGAAGAGDAARASSTRRSNSGVIRATAPGPSTIW